MVTRIEKTIEVNVPVHTAYNQWTQFEEFPQFMEGVERVTQLDDGRLQWVAEIAGVHREWLAEIQEQKPDRQVSWAAVEGVTNAGTVTFEEIGPERTEVDLVIEYEPEGFLENVGDKLDIIEMRAEGDLERFRDFIEARGHETGAWRGEIHEGETSSTGGTRSGMGMHEGELGETSGRRTGRGMTAGGMTSGGMTGEGGLSGEGEGTMDEPGTPLP